MCKTHLYLKMCISGCCDKSKNAMCCSNSVPGSFPPGTWISSSSISGGKRLKSASAGIKSPHCWLWRNTAESVEVYRDWVYQRSHPGSARCSRAVGRPHTQSRGVPIIILLHWGQFPLRANPTVITDNAVIVRGHIWLLWLIRRPQTKPAASSELLLFYVLISYAGLPAK